MKQQILFSVLVVGLMISGVVPTTTTSEAPETIKHATVNHGKTANLLCPINHSVVVTAAVYSKAGAKKTAAATACANTDVLQETKKFCINKPLCVVEAADKSKSETCKQRPLNIDYKCVGEFPIPTIVDFVGHKLTTPAPEPQFSKSRG